MITKPVGGRRVPLVVDQLEERALICRGTRDNWYSPEKFSDDTRRIRAAGADVRPLEFDGGHEWSDAVVQAASAFLRERQP